MNTACAGASLSGVRSSIATMGANNRARRAAKSKARQQARREHAQRDHGQRDRSGRVSGGATGGTGGNSYGGRQHDHDTYDFNDPFARERILTEQVDALWHEVYGAVSRDRSSEPARRRLAQLDASAVNRGAERLLLLQIDQVWAHGWQPAELVRHVTRVTKNRTTRDAVSALVAADYLRRPPTSIDARWRAQIESLDIVQGATTRDWITTALRGAATRAEALLSISETFATLRLGRLDVLIPPPGADSSTTWPPGGGAVAPDTAADPVIERVRNLLAKAESTEFEAEAAAFTAKAQELIVRHAIDQAMLTAGDRRSPEDRPVAIRVFVDAPYADAKSLLLQMIARQSRCRTVFLTGLDMSTVVGFPADVAAVHVLFTSLLVQAQAALNNAARTAAPGTRTRSAGFRAAFYQAFAQRIDERLSEASKHAADAAAAEYGDAFLPVLAGRQQEVDDLFNDRFTNLTSGSMRRSYDRAGWASGQLAADTAKLHRGDLTDEATDDPTPPEPAALRPFSDNQWS